MSRWERYVGKKKQKIKVHDGGRSASVGGSPAAGAKKAKGPTLPALDRDIMLTVAAYLEQATQLATQDRRELTALGEVVSDFLGEPASGVPLAVESVGDHRLVDLDLALKEIGNECGGTLMGVSGGDQRQHQSFPDLLLNNGFAQFGEGAVDYAFRATGPGTSAQVVSFGLWLLEFEGARLAALVRGASPQYGRAQAQVEILCSSPEAVSSFQARLRDLMVKRSALRGKVLTFQPSEWGQGPGASFVPRPEVWAEDVILPDGVLEEVTRHVVGIAEHRDELLEAGQHLKRGVLLYGPPGTGKTLTVRHLLSVTEGTTAILLTGSSIGLISEAAELARTFQPAIVVMEDIDLVAMERGATPQPLLFEVLDALDGLDGDADVAFVMTTNRVKVLERALAQRPGRVDLAVEIPLPALPERRKLLEVYARDLGFSSPALDEAAQESEGTTGSFAKELMRRAVLLAVEQRRSLGDDHLDEALKGLMASSASLTRRLLGSVDEDSAEEDEQAGDDIVEAGPGLAGVDFRPLPRFAPPAYASEISIVAEGVDPRGGASTTEGSLPGHLGEDNAD